LILHLNTTVKNKFFKKKMLIFLKSDKLSMSQNQLKKMETL